MFSLLSLGPAQTFTVLHSFTKVNTNGLNNDGALPWDYDGLALSGNTVYGTARSGGASGQGTVFAVLTDGTGFRVLHGFSAVDNLTGANSDGAGPIGVVLAGSTLYGVTFSGGSEGQGTVFAVKTDGTGFTTLYTFAGLSDGANPAGVILSSNVLYGTTGNPNDSTVFKLNVDGTAFTTLHSFVGVQALGRLTLSGNTLYGTTVNFGPGAIFSVNTDGTDYETVYAFSGGSDGADPVRGLSLWNNVLYGATKGGGSSTNGTLFRVNTDGTGFSVLHSFTARSGTSLTNSDGAGPSSGLLLSGITLYGGTLRGGIWGWGTLFSIKTDGSGFTVLHHFSAVNQSTGANSEGYDTTCPFILSGNNFYATASAGGTAGSGTIFSLLPKPQLTISASDGNAVLTWPATAAGFTLQSTTTLASSASWTNALSSPVIINGRNTVTNPISGRPSFYRLSQ